MEEAKHTPEIQAAFEAWASRHMPWVLEKPEDDTERLVRVTALIAFGHGYHAGRAAIKSATGQ